VGDWGWGGGYGNGKVLGLGVVVDLAKRSELHVDAEGRRFEHPAVSQLVIVASC
jgi:hypothetical protein